MWQRDKEHERRQLELQRLEELKQLREKNMLNVPINFDSQDKLQVEKTPEVFNESFLKSRKKQRPKEVKTIIVYRQNTTLMLVIIALLIVAIVVLIMVFALLSNKPL